MKAVVRTVRGISNRMLLTAGWAPGHAACAILPDTGAVLLLGARRAGKTTTLLQLLAARPPAVLVANSEVFIDQTATGFVARGTPRSVAVRPPTAASFPALAELAHRSAGEPAYWEYPPDETAEADNRLLVSPASLADIFGGSLRAEAWPVAVVVVDHRDETVPHWHPLAPREARPMLISAYMQPWLPDNPYEQDRITTNPARLRDGHLSVLAALADAAPAAILSPGDHPATALRGVLHGLLG